MTVVINGESREIPDGLTVAGMIEHLGMPLDRVALERNHDVFRAGEMERNAGAAGRQF